MKPWRHIIEPHKDVAGGKYQQAEFAANLADVLEGKAESEYQDPNEFFNRTHLTKGMKLALASALERTDNKGGEPVIQLKTAFGGGKTHTMISLYHLFKSPDIGNNITVKTFLKDVGFEKIPRANIAVLVGSALDASVPKIIPEFSHKINTLWGYMAYQLGKEDAYDLVKEADAKSISPGADNLVEMLNKFGPCVILIDELIVYARNIYNVHEHLPSGSFESLMTFIHNLTEAVKRSKNSMVIATIPESDIEKGGEGGKAALERIEKTFGRLEAIWRPVEANEGFEIVRRRLFESIKANNDIDKEDVCKAFSKLYTNAGTDFPKECKEAAYLERIKETYPIHPEIFDRLYSNWSTLEKFQRTRGVLRLMAIVIHELWVSGDNSLMIMPGNIPIYSSKVKNELTRYLSDEWNSIIDNDIDGELSEPKKIDEDNSRYGKNIAARRIARTIFLGSAPSSKEQKNRGIEDVRILLGVVQPEENIAVFKDALSTLSQKLTYLYSLGNRYWYDPHPNLRKTVEDRAGRLDQEDVYGEIIKRINNLRNKGEFAGIHICPESEDVLDEDSVKLVILSPKHPHRNDNESSEAIMNAKQILENRGNSPRHYKNMLIFLSADFDTITNLNDIVRTYLAWKSIEKDQEILNLDIHQKTQTEENIKNMNKMVGNRINDAYAWLLIPTQESTNPITIIPVRITKKEGSLITRIYKQAIEEEYIIAKWSPQLLKNELDKGLWKDQEYINLKQLWEYFSSYPYLPRLRDSAVLIESIREGLRGKEFFGYASNVDEHGKYLGLEIGNPYVTLTIDTNNILIKKDVVLRQMEQIGEQGAKVGPRTLGDQSLQVEINKQMFRKFYGTVELDPIRPSKDIDRITNGIIQHLATLPSAHISISLEINANIPSGIPEKIKLMLIENCGTLKFKTTDFE